MTLEEKLKELRVLLHKLQFDYYDHGANMHTIVPDSDIKNIMKFVETLCQQEIDEACKKQRETCADAFMTKEDYLYIKLNTPDTISTLKRDEILNAPSPKER